MVIENSLDISPPPSIDTIQTSSEAANNFINSLIISCILANFGSAVSKLIASQKSKRFSYNSWLRAFIFANSDDLLRIFGWLRGKNEYVDEVSLRAEHNPRRDRLVLPMLARAFIFAASVLSITFGQAREKTFKGCESKDFRLSLDPTNAVANFSLGAPCINIPLNADVGSAAYYAQYCALPSVGLGQPNFLQDMTEFTASREEKTGIMSIYIQSGADELGFAYRIISFVSWQRLESPDVSIRSNIDNVRYEDISDIGVTLIKEKTKSCILDAREPVEVTVEGSKIEGLRVRFLQCPIDGLVLIDEIGSALHNSLFLEQVDKPERRIKVDRSLNSTGFSSECPLDVIVSYPFFNTVPLLIFLAAICVFNILVTWYISHRVNAFDAAFHLIKEALGHDTTSNPLEENTNREEIMSLSCHRWLCRSSGDNHGHLGFLARRGDVPVAEFNEDVIVGGCRKAVVEIHAAQEGTWAAYIQEKSNTEGEEA